MVTLLNPLVDTTENAVNVPIATSSATVIRTVIFSIEAQNLTPQIITYIPTQFQLTGYFDYTPGVGYYILRTNSPTEGYNGTFVTKPVLTNFLSAANHEVVSMLGVDTGMPAGNYYYNVVCYGLSNHAQPGDQFVVDANSGQATVLVFDPAAP